MLIIHNMLHLIIYVRKLYIIEKSELTEHPCLRASFSAVFNKIFPIPFHLKQESTARWFIEHVPVGIHSFLALFSSSSL